MGRPLGSRNAVTANVKTVVTRLERAGRISLERCFETLYAIATDPKEPAAARIAAVRCLFDRAFGLPRAHIDIAHGLGESAVELLLKIHGSDEHRRNLESLQRWRDAHAITATVLDDEEAASQ